MSKGIDRREFFKVAALSGVATAMAGCTDDPVEEMIPLLLPPDDYVPGISIHFATVCQECPAQCGMVVRTREGRAVKVEGNKNHPLNQGALCAIGQSSLQGLYNLARIPGPTKLVTGEPVAITWAEGQQTLTTAIKRAQAKGGQGRILYFGPPNSGSFRKLLDQFLTGIGGKNIAFDPTPLNSLRKANELVFGRNEIPEFRLEQVELLLDFGTDLMESWLNPVEMSRKYGLMHGYRDRKKGKHIAISPHISLTAASADDWIACTPGDEAKIAFALTYEITKKSTRLSANEKATLLAYLKNFTIKKVAADTAIPAERILTLAKEFQTKQGLAIAGGISSAGSEASWLHIAVTLLNFVAGNIGKSVVFGAEYQLGGDSLSDIRNAVFDMQQGKVDVVLIHNTNPVFALPASLGFAAALKQVPHVISLSSVDDETTALANVKLPTASSFESWGDSIPRNGVYGLQQPVMGKIALFNTMEAGDLLLTQAQALGINQPFSFFRDYLQAEWKAIQRKLGDNRPFDLFWKESLQKGGQFVDYPSVDVTLQPSLFSHPPQLNRTIGKGKLNFLPVNSILTRANGMTGNRPWLVEIPHPITQVVWDSWLEIHPDTAESMSIKHGDLVTVTTADGAKLQMGAYLYHGIAKNSVAMPVGFGHQVQFEGKQRKTGENVMTLLPLVQDSLSGDLAYVSTQVDVKATGHKAFMVSVDGQWRDDIHKLKAQTSGAFGDRSQKGRGMIQSIALKLAESGENKGGQHLRHRAYQTDFYEPMPIAVKTHPFGMQGNNVPEYYKPYKWGMVIDLDRCTGCSACVVACYAENNIPTVGKERQVAGREMSWLRIERFFDKDPKTGELRINLSPQMCQQCDNAGCEPVCPVYATYHNPEGLNTQVYNRCVGTRYCSNNCIYKQRRFNWRTYDFPSPLHMQLNPDVTVREKGVMEKCTFCIQRIREKKDLAKDQGRLVLDGEIEPACQQTCPTRAIVFGNVADKNSVVSKIIDNTKRGYLQFEELNFKPSVTFLKKVTHEKNA